MNSLLPKLLHLFAWPIMAVLLAPLHCAFSADDAFENFRELAVRTPEKFGFSDADSAKGSRIGKIYAYFSIAAWEALAHESSQSIRESVQSPPSRFCEVLDSENRPCCVFISAKTEGGDYRGVLLGYPNLQDELFHLSDLVNRGVTPVVLVEPKTRKLSYVNSVEPKSIQSFTNPTNK